MDAVLPQNFNLAEGIVDPDSTLEYTLSASGVTPDGSGAITVLGIKFSIASGEVVNEGTPMAGTATLTVVASDGENDAVEALVTLVVHDANALRPAANGALFQFTQQVEEGTTINSLAPLSKVLAELFENTDATTSYKVLIEGGTAGDSATLNGLTARFSVDGAQLLVEGTASTAFAKDTGTPFLIEATKGGTKALRRVEVVIDADNDAPTRTTTSPPEIALQEATPIQDSPVIDVNSLFTDPDSELSFALVGSATVEGVRAVLGADGMLRFDGTPTDLVKDKLIIFTVTASDGDSQANASITVTITADNDPPRPSGAKPITVSLVEEVDGLRKLVALPSLFVDPDNHDELTYSLSARHFADGAFFVGSDDEGIFLVAGGRFSATAAATITLTVTAADGESTATRRVEVRLEADEDGPRAVHNEALMLSGVRGVGFTPVTIDHLFDDDSGPAGLSFRLKAGSFTAAHGITAVDIIGGTTLSITGDFNDDVNLSNTQLSFTLEAFDGSGNVAEKQVILTAVATGFTVIKAAPPFGHDLAEPMSGIVDFNNDGFDDLYFAAQISEIDLDLADFASYFVAGGS